MGHSDLRLRVEVRETHGQEHFLENALLRVLRTVWRRHSLLYRYAARVAAVAIVVWGVAAVLAQKVYEAPARSN